MLRSAVEIDTQFDAPVDVRADNRSLPAPREAVHLAVTVIGPDQSRREKVIQALTPNCTARQVSFYPPPDRASEMAQLGGDVYILDLDGDPDQALDLTENLSQARRGTVMVFSERRTQEQVLACMRAGAREFLPFPMNPDLVAQALQRAEMHTASLPELPLGKLFTFLGAKGGSGTTAIACNFAAAAARSSKESVLLIDLDLPMGDLILNFGPQPEVSVVDALNNYQRLDGALLADLLVRHSSGLSILAAPGNLAPVKTSIEAIDKLILIACQQFGCVIVDLGARFDFAGSSRINQQGQIYLVSQVSIADLRNSNRILSSLPARNVEVILNRCSRASMIEVGDAGIAAALGREPRWRVPNDYQAVQTMQTEARPLVMNDSVISRSIDEIVCDGLHLEAVPKEPRKKILGFF